jgi:uncharacterized membrane protein YdbT with pleckstrin-like domain
LLARGSVAGAVLEPLGTRRSRSHLSDLPTQELPMTLTFAHITPLVALVAGILILIMPRLLNYIVAIYLILIGIIGLNSIHHFMR